uniref:Uncharacterized protein n=1 Tax=Anguilla anguilla TaxID=7936 RepID=A0A0E9RDG2_ANGAN
MWLSFKNRSSVISKLYFNRVIRNGSELQATSENLLTHPIAQSTQGQHGCNAASNIHRKCVQII